MNNPEDKLEETYSGLCMSAVMSVCASVDQHKHKQAVRAEGDIKEQEESVEKRKWSLSNLYLQTYQFRVGLSVSMFTCLCAVSCILPQSMRMKT